MTACEVLVLAAHPDDAEIACAGTMLGLVARGVAVVVADLTRGEKGTLGSADERAAEAAAAARALGIAERVNLGLPDAAVRDDDAALRAVVELVRTRRPRLLLAPVAKDVHPDHEAAGQVARRAFFHAGLRASMPELGAPHRPRLLVQYPGNDLVAPTFCVDIGDHVDRKREVLQCYASQIGGADDHRIRKLDVLDRAEARDRWFGSLAGCRAAEPFVVDGPLPLGGLDTLLGRDTP